MNQRNRAALGPLGLFFALALILLVPRAAEMPLMDRDEPKFAQATQEMIQRGEWITPYFNGEYRFDKPILVYWMMRGFDFLAGHNELGARAHSIVCAALVAWLLFLMAARWFGRREAWGCALAWLLTVQVLIHGQLCVADMALMLGIVMTQFAALEMIRDPRSARFGGWFWLMTAGVAVGFLAKGPLGAVVPWLGYGIALWPFRGKFSKAVWRIFGVATLLGLGIAALWGIPAILQTDGAFFRKGIGEHVVERGLRAFNGRLNIPLVYYLVTSLVVFLPWTAWFPLLIRRRPESSDPLRAALWGWFLAPFLIFSFYSTQLPHYVLPGLPAMLLLLFSLPGGIQPGKTAHGFAKHWRRTLTGIPLVLTCALFGLGFWFPGSPAPVQPSEGLSEGLLAWAGGAAIPQVSDDTPLGLLFVGAGVFFAGISAVTLFAPRGWRPVWLVPAVLMLSGGGWMIAKALRQVNPILRSGILTQAKDLDPDTWFQGCRYFEPSLVYYTNRRWVDAKKYPEAFQMLERQESGYVAVFLLRSWKISDHIAARLTGKEARPNQDFRDSIIVPGGESDPRKMSFEVVSGLNGARSEWCEILVVRQRK